VEYIRTKNLDTKTEKKISEYCKQKSAIQFLKLIGSWDVEIELETNTEDVLYALITEIRSEFSGIIRDYDVLKIMKHYKYNFYPFEE